MTPPPMSAAGEAITDIASAIEAAAKEVEATSFTTTSDGRLHKHNAIKFALANRIRTLTARVAVAPEAADPGRETISRSEIKKLWLQHGGRQHGPHIEHYSIEERLFYPFAQALIAAALTLDPVPADPAVEGTARCPSCKWCTDIVTTTDGGKRCANCKYYWQEHAALARSVGPDLRACVEECRRLAARRCEERWPPAMDIAEAQSIVSMCDRALGEAR